MNNLLKRSVMFGIAFATALPAAAQVYVPPPVQVPAPTNYGNIAVNSAIGRAALQRRCKQERVRALKNKRSLSATCRRLLPKR